MAKGFILNEDEARRTGRVVAVVEGTPGIFRPKTHRREVRLSAVCDPQNAKINIAIFGSPTGGTFQLVNWNIDGTTASPTFNWDDTSAEVETIIVAAFSNVDADDINNLGGAFPDASIELEFVNDLANKPIALPPSVDRSLTGGSGVGVIVSLSQLGIA